MEIDDKTPICHLHEIIQDKISCIEILIESEKYNKDNVLKLLNEIYVLIKKAKNCGIKMENRLNTYKMGIEKLGFKRIK